LVPVTLSSRSVRRILIFAEAVTLAHVARPLCFAAGMNRGRYRVAIATAKWAAPHIVGAGIECLDLESIEPRRFLAALSRGRALYDAPTLQRYVDADLKLIERFAPDLVVGDFRLSLSVSARLAGVPYVSIASAYWSPHYAPPRWPVPSLPLTRRLPLVLAQMIFSVARPFVFSAHCKPLNSVRGSNGLPKLPRDIRRIYTDADYVAYSDLAELFPMNGMPPTHRFLGPALWQPAGERPAWWGHVSASRPCIYLTLGSSGDASLLPSMVTALAALPVTLMVACPGGLLPASLPANVLQAPYLPGLDAARRAQLVISNGGSLTTYQALAAGTPVLGVASNLDQLLNMLAIEAAGAGLTLRADRISARALRAATERLLTSWRRSDHLEQLRRRCEVCQLSHGAAALVDELIT
jgi:UDP:flavonoid glycosyltransferase YjiC (YdhE family)